MVRKIEGLALCFIFGLCLCINGHHPLFCERIMLVDILTSWMHHLHSHHFQTNSLETGDDLSDEAALDAVGFDKYKGFFHKFDQIIAEIAVFDKECPRLAKSGAFSYTGVVIQLVSECYGSSRTPKNFFS